MMRGVGWRIVRVVVYAASTDTLLFGIRIESGEDGIGVFFEVPIADLAPLNFVAAAPPSFMSCFDNDIRMRIRASTGQIRRNRIRCSWRRFR